MDHHVIQRKNETVCDLLCLLTRADAQRGTGGRNPDEQYTELERCSGSRLEKKWLSVVRQKGCRLPDKAQFPLDAFNVRPDFGYDGDSPALIFIDGPHHETDHQMQIHAVHNHTLSDAGYEVVRFSQDVSSWPAIFSQYPDVFGKENLL